MIKNSPVPVDIAGTKIILNQMMNCICKIKINAVNGTGFFCKIPYKNSSKKVLMTNYHILNDVYYKQNKEINLFLNDDKEVKIINLGIERKTYFNKDYDMAMVEIKENDNINNYLELDDNLVKNETQAYYKDISIYTLHYPLGNKASVSYGLSSDIDNYEIKHLCSTEHGSSGSPILNLSNNKVIGIHKQGSKIFNFNLGTCLKFPLIDFYRKNMEKKANLKNLNFNINNHSSNENISNVTTNLALRDLFIDMKKILKPGRMANATFTTIEGHTHNCIVNCEVTIDQLLKYYLRRMNKAELIGTNKLNFIFNGSTLKFGDQYSIENYFGNNPSPKITVSQNNYNNVGNIFNDWGIWTKEEEELIKMEIEKN